MTRSWTLGLSRRGIIAVAIVGAIAAGRDSRDMT